MRSNYTRARKPNQTRHYIIALLPRATLCASLDLLPVLAGNFFLVYFSGRLSSLAFGLLRGFNAHGGDVTAFFL